MLDALRPSRPLVEAAWVRSNLGAPGLLVVDATVRLDQRTSRSHPARADFESGHIPGAVFADMVTEFSDPAGDEGLPEGMHAYRLPSPEAFARAAGALGVGDDTVVVTYDAVDGMWAARLRWMLRVFGHEHVAVLDGGWRGWLGAGGTAETGPARTTPATFTARPRPGMVATRDEVSAGVDDGSVLPLNALSPERFRGLGPTPLPRPGRIPGSVNLPYTDVFDADGRYLSPDELRRLPAVEAAAADGAGRVVAYCGAGIAATVGALALELVGVDAAVYDGSLIEWSADPSAPLVTG